MKKLLCSSLMICLIVLVGFSVVLGAETKDVHTTMILRNSWDQNQSNNQADSQEALIYWSTKWVLGGLEVFRSQDYLYVRPVIGLNIGKWTPYLGGSFDSQNNQFFTSGLRFADSWGKISVFFDGREYFKVQGQQEDFSDLFLQLSIPLPNGFFAGIDTAYDHFWDSGSNWVLVGPFVGYNISEGVAIFARISRDWMFSDKGQFNDKFRVGVIFSF